MIGKKNFSFRYSTKKRTNVVNVIRNGIEDVIDVKDLVVSDIALLEPVVPCDGVFLGGHRVRCDELGATGELDAIKKVSYDEYHAMLHKLHAMCSESDQKRTTWGDQDARANGAGIRRGRDAYGLFHFECNC
jgi:magnesium-transporting ATPase (P-type)